MTARRILSPWSALALVGAGAVAALCVAPARAVPLTIVNASFEVVTLGTSFASCGTGCSFSSAPIAGWSGGTGQFMPGPAAGNFTFYNSVPDSLTVAYVLSVPLTQVLAATAQAGATYTLTTLIGYRKDTPSDGWAELVVGNNVVTASGTTLAFNGNWSLFTAVYTATALDAGAAIAIRLKAGSGGQGSFDAVTLDASGLVPGVPEPGTWALLIGGFGAVGGVARRQRSMATRTHSPATRRI